MLNVRLDVLLAVAGDAGDAFDGVFLCCPFSIFLTRCLE